MAEYGYIRVSSRDQNEERQLIAMRELKIPGTHIFTDKQSGKDFDRPQYRRLVRRLKKDDIYNAVLRAVDMRPMAIMEKFGLMNPIFSRVSCYGHFGSNAADMPWERTDLQLSV